MCFELVSLHTQEVTITIIHTGKLRHRAAQSLTQGHTFRTGWSPAANPGLQAPAPSSWPGLCAVSKPHAPWCRVEEGRWGRAAQGLGLTGFNGISVSFPVHFCTERYSAFAGSHSQERSPFSSVLSQTPGTTFSPPSTVTDRLRDGPCLADESRLQSFSGDLCPEALFPLTGC